jgi:alkanesulfonate monooxygenase SsuD/methylene tetrahydromethanopterin reductase-like flavin-dependent oxidoreductase (luciferase family)
MRQPDLEADRAELYKTMLDICEWADGLGFDEVYIGEHHSAEDGYIPQPVVLASAVGARTRKMKIHLSALLVTMYHPLHLAEQLAIADLVSNGRIRITAGMGYRPHEFEMFGVDAKKKVRIFLDALEVLKQAWAGEPFEFAGRTVRVTPKPAQPGGPQIIMGGSAEAAARRAAKLGYDFLPGHPDLYEVYKAELARLGKPEPPPLPTQKPYFLHVTDDPERDWPIVGPHVLYTVNSYARWATERQGGTTQYAQQQDIGELRKQDLYQVLTPEDCVEYAKSIGHNAELHFQPLYGGLAPEIGWKSLKLFEEAVLPRLREEGLRP